MMRLYSNLPQLDLHGSDRDYARILINEFVADNYKLKQEKIIIIHGIGTGIIRQTTKETLTKNKYVESFKTDNFNAGTTVVILKKKIDNKY